MSDKTFKQEKTKIIKRVISLTSSVVFGVVSYVVVKKCENNVYAFIPYANADKESINKGDSVRTTDNVNMRLDTSTESFKVGVVDKGYIVDRIISLNGFDLVRYNGRIAFVSSNYTDSNIEDYNNEYYSVEQDSDIVRTTTKVYFRLGPSKSENYICLLDKNEELTVLGKSTSYNDPNDIWYLAKYKDQIGFVKAEFTRSLKETIQSIDHSITNVEIQNIGYLKNNSFIYNNQYSVIDSIEAYQTVKVLGEKDNNYIVEYNDLIGLIPKENVNKYNGTFVVVDLSSQKIYLYCNTDMVFESVCTTGSNKRPTDTGAFTVYERTNSRYFSKGHEARYMWANFDHGNGIHDAPWEPNEEFGSEKYRKYNGSNGCVRLPDDAALFLKKCVKYGTKVLVKK